MAGVVKEHVCRYEGDQRVARVGEAECCLTQAHLKGAGNGLADFGQVKGAPRDAPWVCPLFDIWVEPWA